jgi:hypothetical protein
MGVVAIGFALYCLYDGFIGYPARQAKGFAEFKALSKSLTEQERSAATVDEFEAIATKDGREAWHLYAHQGDIPARAEIVTQFVMAAIAGVAGVFLLSIPLRARGRWIELDDSTVRTSWGQSFELDQIEVINKRKWRGKGIARIYYRDGGRVRQFVLDDFKFLRKPTDEIMFEIEQRVGSEKITGGPPESLAEHVEEPAHAASPDSVDGASSSS